MCSISALAANLRFNSIDARRANVANLLPPIEEAIAGRALAELAEALHHDVPHAIVNDYPAAARDPHVMATDGVAWFSLDEAPPLPFVNVPGAAALHQDDHRARIPVLDGDREEILSEIGLV